MAKGLDIGTCFLVCASKDPKDPKSEIQINSVRDAFLDIEAEQSVLNMLKMSNISYVPGSDNNVFITGDSALSMANMFKKEARRPLSKGIISAGDLDAERILVTLIKSILKEPVVENEVCYYSIPAKPVDRENINITYHEEILRRIISNCGYKAVSLNEAAAIVYANCGKSGFTALCSSIGAGMCNTSIVYKTLIGSSWSISTAGDWIDENAAKAVGSTATRLMSIKEKGINLLDPLEGDQKYLREREAIIVYYKNLIRNIIESVKREYKKDNSKIELPEDIPWIISGGTSLAKNFIELFKIEVNKVKDSLPVRVSVVTSASDPLNDVAKGLLIAAMND
jgi:actin-like ATPase involved in cell morphogenesis